MTSGHRGPGSQAPDPIKKFVELDEKVDKILTTIGVEHSEAYTRAARKVLQDDDGRIDMDRLKDEGKQEAFVDEMVDHYLTSAKKILGVKEGGPSKDDPLGVDMLLHAAHGYTKSDLMQQVRMRQHNYSLGQHEGIRNELLQDVEKRLRSSAASHLKDSHREGLVQYAKATDFIDHTKMRLPEAVHIARQYRVKGAIAPKEYDTQVFYKKEEGHGGGGHH